MTIVYWFGAHLFWSPNLTKKNQPAEKRLKTLLKLYHFKLILSLKTSMITHRVMGFATTAPNPCLTGSQQSLNFHFQRSKTDLCDCCCPDYFSTLVLGTSVLTNHSVFQVVHFPICLIKQPWSSSSCALNSVVNITRYGKKCCGSFLLCNISYKVCKKH